MLLWMTQMAVGANGWNLFWLKNRMKGRRIINDKAEQANEEGRTSTLEYDMIIVGAGASGMFASGASTMLGAKTLLLDIGEKSDAARNNNIGGDCTNAACVPSKAVRSVARMAPTFSATQLSKTKTTPKDWLSLAREHATKTVNKVRARESPAAMVARNKNLDIALLTEGKFVNSHEMDLNIAEFFSARDSTIPSPSTKIRVRGKKFIIATGASPFVPKRLEREANESGLPLYTYRTLLRPESESKDSLWNLLNTDTATESRTELSKRIVIAGGGATACELTQSLARLTTSCNHHVEIHLVAPGLLPKDDVILQNAALQLLSAESTVHFHLNNRVESVLPDGEIQLSDGSTICNADALLLCLGRKPSLESLRLEDAGIVYHKDHGVLVCPSSLQSISSKHVYACGDCASAVNDRPGSRTATHAAWTGYHAASNAILPRILTIGSKSVHPTVPRVVYTDPELISVGMSLAECIRKYGAGGFDRLLVGEEGTDRADMESLERPAAGIGFVEIRATKWNGRVLGLTACGPSAAELANEMSVVIENKLTVRDIARSLHSYPSHGYLMHRVALSLALGNVWGSLEACGPLGGFLARPGRVVSKIFHLAKLPWKFQWGRRKQDASRARQGILTYQKRSNMTDVNVVRGNHTNMQIISGLDIYIAEALGKKRGSVQNQV